MQVNVMNLGLIQRIIIQLKRFVSFGVLYRHECNCLFACAYIEKFFQLKVFTLDLKIVEPNISFVNLYHTFIDSSFPKTSKQLVDPTNIISSK